MEDELSELTTSGAVPPVVKPFAVRKRVFPATLTGVVDKLRTYKKKMAAKLPKTKSVSDY